MEEWEYYETVHQLFIDFKKAYDLVKVKLLKKFLELPMKLDRVFKICLNEPIVKSV
jgi:hypothetical protein